MATLVLYTNQKSPPCRAVKLTVRALGLTVTEKEMTLVRGDKLMEEFSKASHRKSLHHRRGALVTIHHGLWYCLLGRLAPSTQYRCWTTVVPSLLPAMLS